MDFSDALEIVTQEVGGVLKTVEPSGLEALGSAIAGAKRVFVAGQGRSGLVARAFAMRLMHLGLSVHVVGETTTTAIGKGDLLLALSCSGRTGVTCVVARKAVAAGARLCCITSGKRSRLARLSDVVATVKAPSKDRDRRGAGSRQFGSTLFEQCCLILLDALCLVLADRLGESSKGMMARHTNLE